MRFGNRFSWVFGLLVLSQSVGAATALTDSLIGRAFVDAEDSAPYLSRLVDVSEAQWKERYPFLNRAMLDQVARGFQFHSGEGEIELKLNLMKMGAESYSNLILLGVFQIRSTAEPVGFFAINFWNPNPDEPEAIGDLLKTDLTRNLGGIFAPFFATYESLIAIHRVRKERILAGWSGRVLWATRGLYEFDSDYSYNLNGRNVSTITLIRENFGRFLAHHEIAMDDLTYRGGPLLSLAQIAKPADFLKIRHRAGKKVRVEAYVDCGELRTPHEYAVGMAFLLSDSRAQPNQANQISLRGRNYSDRSMPAWPGVRIHAASCSRAFPSPDSTCAETVWVHRGGCK
jgi:hypothetical protein